MDELRMSGKERVRLEVMGRVERGELTRVESVGLMGVSLRQARRIVKRFRPSGDAGLVHGLGGRASNRRLSEDVRERVVKRMRLRGIRSIEAGNDFLDAKSLDELNGRYAVKARRGHDLHRAADAGVVSEEVPCVAEGRVVGNDWCVRWNNRRLQTDAKHAALNLPGKKVTAKQRSDGVPVILRDDERLRFTELRGKPARANAKKPVVNNKRYKPAASHPWHRDSGPASGRRAG